MQSWGHLYKVNGYMQCSGGSQALTVCVSAQKLYDEPAFMSDDIRPPGIMLQMLESRAGLEATQLLMQLPLLRMSAPRGKGQPLMVLPGFMADDNSTFFLRRYLTSLGYSAYPWELGVNRHRMLDFLPLLHERIEQLYRSHGSKVTLVGWSRGGIISREIARDAPEYIRQVITIGSPVKGGVSAASIGNWVKRETGLPVEVLNNLLRERQRKPIRVPVRAIYSKLDGVVAWKACIDDQNPDVEHFEINGTHIGMGTNAEVYRLLGRLLAES
ncbi:MAG: alpha/beta hydrolase [Pseudomonadales bacterium]|nr:alpha/beta hydrolase [Pseudomonadales bacterium]